MNKNQIIYFSLAITVITIFILYPCLKNGFVDWDDNEYVIENMDIRVLSIQNISKIFSTYYIGSYVPLTILSFAIDYQIGRLNPAIYHLTNLIFHLLNSLLVFWAIYLLCKRGWISFLTAVLFAIHPLHVESVAWIPGRKDVLYGFFFISAIISYLYYRIRGKERYYFLSLFFFIFSLLAKPMAITLPFVLIAIDHFVFNQLHKKTLVKMIPMFILSIVFIYIGVDALHSARALNQGSFTFPQRITIASSNYLVYITKTFVPIKLSCIYPIQNYWFAPFILIALIVFLFLSYRYIKRIVVVMIFFTITILPVLQIIPAGQILADRYTYICLTGLFYVFAETVRLIFLHANKTIKNIIIIVVVATISLYAFLANRQCRVWKDGMSLWTYVINNYPTISVAYNNRGAIRSHGEDYQGALHDFNQALRINPQHVNAYVNRGNVYSGLGNYDLALNDYNEAIKIDSTNVDAYHNRAVIYFNRKEYNLALKDLLKIRDLGEEVPDEIFYYIRNALEKEDR